MRFANIQTLRFAAALAVVLYHLGQVVAHRFGLSGSIIGFLKYGMLGMGVYVFFAISGFVLAHSLQATPVKQFLVWRAARLYFPYWALVLVLLIVAGIGGVPTMMPVKPLANAMLLLPAGEGQAAYILGGVEWSLVYEVFFGLVVGLCALAGPRRGVMGGAAIWLALCIGKAIVAPGGVPVFPTWKSILLSPANVPFLLGVLAYELHIRRWAWVRPVSLLAVPGFYALGISIPRPDVSLMVIGVACASAVIWCAATHQLAAKNPLVVAGDWSYGVYLCHPVVIFWLGHTGESYGYLPRSAISAFVIGGAAVIVGLGYGWLESAAYRQLRLRYAPVKPAKPVKLTAVRLKRAA